MDIREYFVKKNSAFIIVDRYIYSNEKDDLLLWIEDSKDMNPFIIGYNLDNRERYPQILYVAYGKAYMLNIPICPLLTLLRGFGRNGAYFSDSYIKTLFAINVNTYEPKLFRVRDFDYNDLSCLIKKKTSEVVSMLEEFEI
jgi:hypothetical protein